MSEDKNFDKLKKVTRRGFLTKAGILTAGVAVGSGLLSLNSKSALAAAPAPPWPWAKLDLDLVKKRAVEGYYDGG